MRYYQFARLNVGIECENEYLINRMKKFQIEPVKHIDLQIIFEEEEILKPIGEFLVEDKLCLLKKSNEEGFITYITQGKDGKKVIMKMESDSKWSDVRIQVDQLHYLRENRINIARCEFLYQFEFAGIAFRNMLIHNNGFVIHASSIKYKSSGIVFSAPSGTGKSTHVNLWKEMYGEEVAIINDDTPSIRILENQPILFGTPWSGSSDNFENIQVPLKAIVIIEQSSENSIRKLTPKEAFLLMIPRCFLPYFDVVMIESAYDIIDRILKTVDIYQLRCLPNKEAVKVVHQCIRL